MGTGPGGATRPVSNGRAGLQARLDVASPDPSALGVWPKARSVQAPSPAAGERVCQAASAAQAGPSGACLQAQGSAFLWAGHGQAQERTGTQVTAHRALCTSWQFTEPGLICRRSGLGSLPDPRVPWDSLWPALPGGRSAAREAWTCVKLRETQAKSPRPGRNLLAENPAVGLPRAASAGRVPLCPPVGLCGHRHR